MTDGAAITDAVVDAVVEAVAPVVADLGLELYDVEISGSGRARILRVMIDRPTGDAGADRAGIDLDAIAAATEAVSPVLDAPPLDKQLNGPYSLEVSSPGLERPLRTPAHFARAVGETISVKTRVEGASTRLRGIVRAAGDDTFDLLADDGTEQQIAYAEVVQARTVFEWGGGTKPGAKSPKQASKGRKKEAVR